MLTGRKAPTGPNTGTPWPPAPASHTGPGWRGNPAGARDLLAALVSVRERVLGPEHPDTLTASANLASWTGDAGDPTAARDLLAELLPVRKRVLGPEHPDTLATLSSLARWTERAE